MCELFAMSSRIETSVSFSLGEFSQHGGQTGHHCDGWGVATYSGKTAEIYREPQAAAFSEKMKFIQTNHRETHCVISHIRRATVGAIALRNTQPFVRQLNGRSHVFAHNGDLAAIKQTLTFNGCTLDGETDSEYAFCYLIASLKMLWQKGIPTLKERTTIIEKVFSKLATFGPANFLYSDGDYLYAFANKRIQLNGNIEPPGMYYLTRQCCKNKEALKRAGVNLGCDPQQVLLFASVPLTDEAWQPLPPNQLLVAEKGDLKTI